MKANPYLDKNTVQTKICAFHENKALHNFHEREQGPAPFYENYAKFILIQNANLNRSR